MPKLTKKLPAYRFHRASGQAVVTLAGRDLYLGPWKSKASKHEYDRCIAEWLAAGRPSHAFRQQNDLSILELINAHRKFAEGYYTSSDGKTADEIFCIRAATGPLIELYRHSRAIEFGPIGTQGRTVAHG